MFSRCFWECQKVCTFSTRRDLGSQSPLQALEASKGIGLEPQEEMDEDNLGGCCFGDGVPETGG